MLYLAITQIQNHISPNSSKQLNWLNSLKAEIDKATTQDIDELLKTKGGN